MSQATLSDRPYVNSNLFSGHYLDERIQQREEWDCDDAAEAAFEQLQDRWEGEADIVETYNEDALISAWIDEVLDALGFGKQPEVTLPDGDGYVDGVLFESDGARQEAANTVLDSDDTTDLFEQAIGLLEAKQWDADFSVRFSEQRPYRNASHQIKHYLERTPGSVQWGILTNGRKWRLYGTKDYETQTFYEIDLPELLAAGDLEQFKYFYAFFRPEAFRETAGTTFLDEVWSESETAAQELGEDLQDNVFTALRVLGRGFVETNDSLDIDPDDEDALDQLKEQSLVLLYRLMFVLYAESRGLIHPEDPASQAEYEENFSLDELRLKIHDEIGETDTGFDEAFSEYSTSMWSRLSDLFRLIDEGEESLGVPPYNGGLFDHDKHAFLAEHEVSDRHLAEVIYRLSTTQNGDGRYVLADYGDLDTRHLGSVYEGLLEHHFRIAPEQYAAVAEDGGQVWKPADEVTVADAVETVPEGGLYVVNDEGERKATGAYYTPDYVVTYIVEETVGPLVEEIREDLIDQGFEPGTQEYLGPFSQRITDLKILDPAMGSGHFLTRATEYLAEEVMAEVREVESELGVAFDEQHIRREIAKECIYGVDVNGMAVELAKLSMWLETLAADRPLAFLDHHLKQGNSLVGSDVTEVLAEEGADEDGQLTIFQALENVRQSTLEHVMDLVEDLLAIDNETLEDVRSMEEIYAEIRADPLYQRLFELTNVDTAEQFGLDVPDGAYEEMANAIEDDSAWDEVSEHDWFNTAQSISREQSFFHWELEYPEVFFNQDGRKRREGGFDAVLGNPPYIKIQNLRSSAPEFAEYAINQYQTSSGRFDIYALFVEQGTRLAKRGRLSYILPNKFFESAAGDSLRNYLSSNKYLKEIVDFGQHQVFNGVTTYTCILSLEEGGTTFQYAEASEAGEMGLQNSPRAIIEISDLSDQKWALTGPRERQVLEKLRDAGTTIGDQTEYLSEGIVSGDNEVMFVEVTQWGTDTVEIESPASGETYHLEPEIVKPLLRGDFIERFGETDTDEGVIYPYEVVNGESRLIPEQKLESEFPATYQYLKDFEERLSERGSKSMDYPAWYALWCPRDKQLFESAKILAPDVCGQCEFTLDEEGGVYLPNSAYGIVPDRDENRDIEYLLGVLNSTPTWFFIYHTSPVLRGDYRRFMTSYLSPLPVPNSFPETSREAPPEFDAIEGTVEDSSGEMLSDLARIGLNLHDRYSQLNLSLSDHLGTYADGQSLADIGFCQPASGSTDTPVVETTETRQSLRIGKSEIVRQSPTSVEIRLTARYKPEDEDAHETDQWGYTETEPLPALQISELTETEADLIEHFVPVAVEEAGGFANFRETATKTNSLVHRLRALTLPDVDDVREGLESYVETKERAEELEAKIERTDELIDEIVYELYGLSEEEIEIVEEAVQ